MISRNDRQRCNCILVSFIYVMFFYVIFVKASLGGEKPEIFVQIGHSENITSISLSPDGKHIFTGSADKTIKLWEIETGREIRTFSGHTKGVQSLAISKNGKYVASGGFESDILLWDIQKGQVIKKYFIGKGKEEAGTHAVAISPDVRSIAAACVIDDSHFIRIYDIQTGRVIRDFHGHEDHIGAIAFSPAGNYLVSGSGWLSEEGKDNTVRVWDIKKGSEIRKYTGHTKGIMSVAFAPDGRSVVSGSLDKTIRVWDVSQSIAPKIFYAAGGVDAVAFSPDGLKLISSERPDVLTLWDIKTGQAIATLKTRATIKQAATFSIAGRDVVFAHDEALAIWNVSEVSRNTIYHEDRNAAELYHYSFANIRKFGGNVRSPSVTYFSTTGDSIKVADAIHGDLFSYNLNLANVIKTKSVKIFDIRSRGMRYIRLIDEADNKNPKYVIFDTQRDSAVMRRPLSGEFPHIKAFSPDGKFALETFCEPARSAVLDTRDFKEISSIPVGCGSLNAFDFSPDGKVMAGAIIADEDPDTLSIKLWDIQTGKQLRKLSGHTHYLTALTFTPDGKRLLSGSMDHTVKIWDIASGKEINTLMGHADVVETIIVSADGKLALTGSWDRTLKLWDIVSGKVIKTFTGHTNNVDSAAFSPDGRYVLSGSRDGTTRIWDISTGKEVAEFIVFKDDEWIMITPEGYFTGSSNGATHLNVRSGNNVYSIDNFNEKFFNPLYVVSALQGKKVETTVDIRKGIMSPPEVQITSPKPNETIKSDSITVTVSAKDTGGGIDEIRLYHNGKAVGEDTRSVKLVSDSRESIKTYAVTLVDNINTFKAVGFSKDRTESNPHELVVRLSIPQKDVAMHVLTVGINNYRNPALNLNYAVPDAKGIATFFGERGTGLFKKVLIIDIYDQKATKAIIIAELKNLEKTNPQDAVLIYLAGHGENIANKWYFIPHELTYPEREEEVKSKGISSDEIAELVRSIKAQKVLLMIDSCKAGAMLIAMRGFEDRKALSQLSRSTGVHVIAASTKDQFAAEVKELGHGVFTYTLLEGLKGQAASGGKIVTVRKLMTHVENHLPDVTMKYRKESQFPVVDSRGMDFPLVILK